MGSPGEPWRARDLSTKELQNLWISCRAGQAPKACGAYLIERFEDMCNISSNKLHLISRIVAIWMTAYLYIETWEFWRWSWTRNHLLPLTAILCIWQTVLSLPLRRSPLGFPFVLEFALLPSMLQTSENFNDSECISTVSLDNFASDHKRFADDWFILILVQYYIYVGLE